MLCPGCHRELPNNAKKCPYCQFPIESEFSASAPFYAQVPVSNNTPAFSAQPQQKKKGVPAWAIILIVLAALIIIGILTSMLFTGILFSNISNSDNQTQTQAVSNSENSAFTSENAAEEEPATSAAGTIQPDFETDLDVQHVSYPKITEFYWVKDASPTTFPAGSVRLTTIKQISGRWKAYYVYSNGVRELCNITVNTAADVAVKPCAINYGYEWHSEYTQPGYLYSGSIANGIVTASSEEGTISLFSFYEYDGKQYGFGKAVLQTGETVCIALVRP